MCSGVGVVSVFGVGVVSVLGGGGCKRARGGGCMRVWMFHVDCVTTNYYCSELCNLRQMST